MQKHTLKMILNGLAEINEYRDACEGAGTHLNRPLGFYKLVSAAAIEIGVKEESKAYREFLASVLMINPGIEIDSKVNEYWKDGLEKTPLTHGGLTCILAAIAEINSFFDTAATLIGLSPKKMPALDGLIECLSFELDRPFQETQKAVKDIKSIEEAYVCVGMLKR